MCKFCFEDLTTTTLKTTWIEITAIVLTVFLLITNIQIPLLTKLMDTIYGKATRVYFHLLNKKNNHIRVLRLTLTIWLFYGSCPWEPFLNILLIRLNN